MYYDFPVSSRKRRMTADLTASDLMARRMLRRPSRPSDEPGLFSLPAPSAATARRKSAVEERGRRASMAPNVEDPSGASDSAASAPASKRPRADAPGPAPAPGPGPSGRRRASRPDLAPASPSDSTESSPQPSVASLPRPRAKPPLEPAAAAARRRASHVSRQWSAASGAGGAGGVDGGAGGRRASAWDRRSPIWVPSERSIFEPRPTRNMYQNAAAAAAAPRPSVTTGELRHKLDVARRSFAVAPNSPMGPPPGLPPPPPPPPAPAPQEAKAAAAGRRRSVAGGALPPPSPASVASSFSLASMPRRPRRPSDESDRAPEALPLKRRKSISPADAPMTTPQLRPITRPSIQLTEPPLGSSLSLSTPLPGRSRRESVPSAMFAQAGTMPQPPFTSRVSSNNPFMPRVSMGTLYTPQHMRVAGQALPAPPPAMRPGSRASLRRRSLGPPQGSAAAVTTTAQAKAAAATGEADTAAAARGAETAGAAPASKSPRASIVSQGTIGRRVSSGMLRFVESAGTDEAQPQPPAEWAAEAHELMKHSLAQGRPSLASQRRFSTAPLPPPPPPQRRSSSAPPPPAPAPQRRSSFAPPPPPPAPQRRSSFAPPAPQRRSSFAPPPPPPPGAPASALQRRSSLGFAVKPNASPGRLPVIDDSGNAVAAPRVVFDPHAHRTSRAFVSNCAAWAHLLNGLLALWLVLHACLFAALGLVGAIFLLIFLAALASYALHMMLRNELAMCCEQQMPWLGLPRALEYACKNGPRPLRATAVCLRITAYVMYILLGLTIITCYVIISSLLLGYLWALFFTPIDPHLYVLLLTPLLLLGCLVPNLRYMWPVSVVAVLALAGGCLVLVVDVLLRPSSTDAPPFPAQGSRALGLPFFVAEELVALSFIIVVVVVEKHMDNPPHLLGVKGCLNWCLFLAVALQILVSTTIYVKFGANLSFDFLAGLSRNLLLDVVIFLFVFGALLSVPLYVYVLHDIIWDMHQHLLQKYSENQKLFWEFGLRVIIIVFCTLLALAFPAYGKENGIPVALTVPLLLWGFPALVELALCWQVKDFGPYKCALWKDISLILMAVICFAFAICYQVAG